jgi:peroxiredoxin
VQEWVGTSEAEAMLLGGDFGVGDHADCYRPNNTFGPGHRNLGIGFRCCAGQEVPNASAKAVEKAAPTELVGSKLPSFSGDLLDGGTTASSSWKGKVTYLTFFASWCGPCQRELPELMALHKKYAGRGFQVISVGVDTESAKSEAFARKVGIDYPVILDPKGDILGKFDVKSMPTTYIIGKDGTIKHKQVGFGDKTITEVTPVIEGLL